MEKLVISLDEVKNIAGELKNLNTQISTKLEDCKKEMNSLNGVWESEGSRTIKERFIYFSKRFLKQAETIDSYARFLDYTVNSYESLESTITQNASTIG